MAKIDLQGARLLGGGRWQRKPKDRITRIATIGALVCAAAFLLVTFLPAHAYGHDCGTWTSPNYGSGLYAQLDRLDSLVDGTATMGNLSYAMVSAQCDNALDSRRLFALLLLVVGAGIRWGVPYAARRADT